MNYYIGDTHFGHANILRLDGRPFSSIAENDECLISNWNETVTDTDDIWVLGDFAWATPEVYAQRLRGRKHLIIGNHDRLTTVARKEFVSIDKMAHVQDKAFGKTVQIHLCHFPLAEWNGYYRGAYHIFAHIHSNTGKTYQIMKQFDKALNAGCMINNYKPVTFEELVLNNRVFRESH